MYWLLPSWFLKRVIESPPLQWILQNIYLSSGEWLGRVEEGKYVLGRPVLLHAEFGLLIRVKRGLLPTWLCHFKKWESRVGWIPQGVVEDVQGWLKPFISNVGMERARYLTLGLRAWAVENNAKVFPDDLNMSSVWTEFNEAHNHGWKKSWKLYMYTASRWEKMYGLGLHVESFVFQLVTYMYLYEYHEVRRRVDPRTNKLLFRG